MLCAALAVGCLPRSAVQRQQEAISVAVAYVVDQPPGAAKVDVPGSLKARVAEELSKRNLLAKEIPPERFVDFGRLKDSRLRFERLAAAADGATLVLLVELQASFFSQLQGRYRWTVSTRLSAGRTQGELPAQESFEQPAFVDFNHEREPEAIGAAASEIATRAGALFDSFLSAREPARQDAIYFVLVDRFENGDPSNDGQVDRSDPAAFHGGDLQGLINRLDELQALGVRTVWLSPVFKLRDEKFFEHGAFHGYWVEDLRQLEPRFGSRELLAKLSDELGRRGMRLMLDLVVNHVAMDAPLTRERPEWFHGKGPIEDWNDPVQLVDHDVHGLPDLATEREDVYRFLLDSSLQWVRAVRPAGFRLDAVKHLPLTFWARFNSELKKASPGLVLLGEMLDGDPRTVARTQSEGKFDAMFDFPLYYALIDVFCEGRSPARLGTVFSQDRLYADPFSLVTLADNHDLPRVLSSCKGELDRVRKLLAVQLTARGTPSLTYGTEAGLTGTQEPQNRGDMRFGEQPLRDEISRLLTARSKHEALRSGVPLMLEAGEGFFTYARVSARQALVVSVNQTDRPRSIPVPSGRISDLLKDERVEAPTVAADQVSVLLVDGELSALHRKALSQWKGQGGTRKVELATHGAPGPVYLVGSGPELGAWLPEHAVGPSDQSGLLRAELSVGSVYEFKLVTRAPSAPAQWEEGENRALFVAAGEAPLRLELDWRS